MAKIGLTSGFSILPEGVYTFLIKAVEYKESFGKLKITLETKDGKRHTEQFSLLDSKGNPNEGAYNAFSFFAKTALNDFDREEIDDQELVGHYIKCSIEHQVVEGNDGKTRTYAHLGRDKEVAFGFDGEAAPAPAPAPAAQPAGDIDLDALLGL